MQSGGLPEKSDRGLKWWPDPWDTNNYLPHRTVTSLSTNSMTQGLKSHPSVHSDEMSLDYMLFFFFTRDTGQNWLSMYSLQGMVSCILHSCAMDEETFILTNHHLIEVYPTSLWYLKFLSIKVITMTHGY